MFGNKKNSKIGQTVGNTFADGFGSTENFGGGFSGGPAVSGFGKTENLPGGGGLFGPGNGEIGHTVAAPGNEDNKNSVFAPRKGVESFGKTVAANLIVNQGGEEVLPVVGWLVCIKGANAGKEFRIHSDYNYMGSSKGDIIIPGDKKISRENHMVIAYDPDERAFFIAPASGANIIRLNDKALVGTGNELKDYDVIKTGDSVFVFRSFCGENFGWEQITNE